jgi:hypothetical protein
MSGRRWAPTDAYADESQRGARYALACVLTRAPDHAAIRSAVRQLMRPRQKRIHFHDESSAERLRLIGGFADLPIRTLTLVSKVRQGVDAEAARAECMVRLVQLLQEMEVPRLVIESRHYDRRDEVTIVRARKPTPPLLFEHRVPDAEPLLWIADGLAWAALASREGRQRLAAVTLRHVDLGG